MSGDEDDPMLLAAEYALGSLDLAEMREAEVLAIRDPAFASEIIYWQSRLSGLAQLVPPVQPPAALWSRLAIATGGEIRPYRRTGGSFWKVSTGVSLAIAAGLALFAFLPQPASTVVAPARFAAALGPLASPARFLAETRADGSIILTNLTGTAAPAGRDYELWALPQGATAPIPLGVLPTGQRIVSPPQRSSAQEQLLVSDEPTGGSPTGAPTGAVLFGGTLVSVSPAATPGQ